MEQTHPFLWVTNDDQRLTVGQMTTLHLFHTVRMLWNHTVPDRHQLRPYREWILAYDPAYRREAMAAMLAELAGRKVKEELTPDHRADLEIIRKGDKVWKRALAKLPPGDDPRHWEDEGDTDLDAFDPLEEMARDIAWGD
jgi:hypothetical protein